jgi:16S rRNA (guanine527-N7)-methyltransferase
VLDLGSGAGLPGLVLARRLPASSFVLLEGRVQQARSLERSVAELGLSERVTVIGERAELAAHRSDLRFSFDFVVARSFGRPAVTAECGAGFLKVGGALVVSEPPQAAMDERWPAEEITRLGLVLVPSGPSMAHFAVLRSVVPLDERYPRRTGVPAKRPLF